LLLLLFCGVDCET